MHDPDKYAGGVAVTALIAGLAVAVAVAVAGCGVDDVQPDPQEVAQWQNLDPVPNPNDRAPSQPRRAHPFAVAMTPDGETALVTLRGSEVAPGNELAIINVPRRRVDHRVLVGARPIAVSIHPDGDLAVVLSHMSPFAAVIDVQLGSVTSKIPVGYYAENLMFSPDGSRMFVTNRAADALHELVLTRTGNVLEGTLARTAPAGVNPGAICASPDGSKLYVAEDGGLGIRVFDAATFVEVAQIPLNAPVFDLAAMGSWVIATTLNDTDGLPCESDADFPGRQGDGVYEIITDRTCSRGFADIQNEIAFIDPAADTVLVRYTSDTAEVSEADREGDHLPELMQVVGSLPYGIAVAGSGRAFVTMGASFEVAELTVARPDPAAPPQMTMPNLWDTGFAPRGIAADAAGTTLVVANMLSDTASIIDVADGWRIDIELDYGGPSFPATSAEIGELFFFSSLFSTDGDQSCTHCHPNSESDGKAWGVEVVRAFGRRSTIPARNLQQTLPLLIEGVFDQTDFTLEMEGMAFRPDFHDSSFALQVQRREAFFFERSRRLTGEEIGFFEMSVHLGNFLMIEPRLLPSPFPRDTPEVELGRELFFRFDVACALCHPSPGFASTSNFEGTTTMGQFDRPRRDLDPDISIKYLEDARDGFFNANTLRGLWDRRGALFHDGRARTARETLLTVGHECLLEGERAFNDFNGQPDVHGGISHLTCEEIDALLAFLLTLD